ncbi:aminoglycoside phosphotransferase family protein [Catellatospora bangladeshensis]|uniref:aminoglycoside phosphotransferase family protein n=1 Tax=Catellatospora bangladeshensis TaxID=310355 RepID=UPI001940C735|nr:aminoglycoside phosphotransferase family protein [Catellatospora bangladeshensis]
MSCVIELPDLMRRTAVSRGAHDWLASLPERVADVCADWALTPGEALTGGSAALVLRVQAADGTDAVLRLAPPGDGFAGQVRTLEAANGHGYVRLYAYDEGRDAALLEPLGPALPAAGLPPEEVLDVLAATLREAWRVPHPPGATVPPGEDKAGTLHELIVQLYPETGEPCSPAVLGRALDYARRRADAFDVTGSVVCHGDAHPDNALAVLTPRAGAESGYVFVDPDGFLCDPGYDLGVAVRGWESELLAAADPVALLRGWCARLATATGVDPQVIWEWGFIERVSSGLYMIRHGQPESGRAYLASAERLLG